MSNVTRERLIKTIEIVEARRKSVCDKGDALMHVLAVAGIRTMAGGEIGDLRKKIALELNYQGIIPEQDEIVAFIDNHYDLRNRYGSWIRQIYRIQRACNISGLIPSSIKLGTAKLDLLLPDENNLVLIKSDLEILKSQKQLAIDFWVQWSVLRGYSFFRDDYDEKGCWTEISVASIVQLAGSFDWAIVDDFSSEFHLRVLNGLDYTSRGVESISFCASRKQPTL